MPFTDPEREYLSGQLLGRLATVAADGTVQNNPVGFRYNEEAGTIDIGGYRMGATRKFRNVRATRQVAFVVDDLVSVQPWRVRGVEVRGWAEALVDQPPLMPGFAGEIIRIHPRRVFSWGLDEDAPTMRARNVA